MDFSFIDLQLAWIYQQHLGTFVEDIENEINFRFDTWKHFRGLFLGTDFCKVYNSNCDLIYNCWSTFCAYNGSQLKRETSKHLCMPSVRATLLSTCQKLIFKFHRNNVSFTNVSHWKSWASGSLAGTKFRSKHRLSCLALKQLYSKLNIYKMS